MTRGRFTHFVILADMRTGSNFLEQALGGLGDVTVWGELFNPSFIGRPGRTELMGFDLARREREPLALLERVRAESAGLAGFRLFSDHDPRVLEAMLGDPACAKIVLGRNPLEAWISAEIARTTGQWLLTDARARRSARVRFDGDAFMRDLAARQGFRAHVRRRLQETGQTAFWIDHEELSELAVLNGLAAWLGSAGRLEALPDRLKRQNPEPPEDKVTNPAEMRAALTRIDPFGLARDPVGPEVAGAGVPQMVAAPQSPLLFQPVPGGPDAAVRSWLARLDGAAPEALATGFTRASLRAWMQANPGHRRFTVLRHPLARAHHVFVSRILRPAGPRFARLAERLRTRYDVPLPEGEPGPGWSARDHRRAFLAYLKVLKAVLQGQTSLPVPRAWAPQASLIAAVAAVAPPDHLIREESMSAELAQLAALAGRPGAPPVTTEEEPGPVSLAGIHDRRLERAARAAYRIDYLRFGFGDWARG